MSITSQSLRSACRVGSSSRSTISYASTSQIILRNYGSPSGPSTSKEALTGKEEIITRDSSKKSAASAFDIDSSVSDLMAVQAAKKSSTTGAKRQGASKQRQEHSRKMMIRFLGGGVLVGAAFMLKNLGREWETLEEMERFASDPSLDNFLTRAKLRIQSAYTSIKAPAWEKLLPDPLPFPYGRPYTLVVDLDDLLVHSEWTRATAWKIAKRPGLDYFLGYLAQWYEIVVFTKHPFYVVAPILEKLDPDRRFFTYHLFRESCRTMDNGQIVKDLSALNRDLSKLIILDTDASLVALQPENAILLPKWDGKVSNKDLIGMVDFFEAIGIYNVNDVRRIIKAYEGTHIPTEHAKRQAAVKVEYEEDWKRKHQSKNSWISGLVSATAKSDVPRSFYELERERCLKGYMDELKYWQDNGDSIRAQAEEERKKQMEEMTMSPWGFLSGGAVKSPGQEQPTTK